MIDAHEHTPTGPNDGTGHTTMGMTKPNRTEAFRLGNELAR